MNKIKIALSKGMVCPPKGGQNSDSLAATLQANIMDWGFVLDKEAFQAVKEAPIEWVIEFFAEAIEYFKEVTGGKHNYKPLFEGFPDQVMEMSRVGHFLNTLAHTWTNGMWQPGSDWEKPVEFEYVNFKFIKYGTEEDFKNIFKSLVSINTSLTPQDMEIVKWFASTYQSNLEFPEEIPFKENLCTLAAMGLDVPVKTPTDVLRIATHMSGGDVTLGPLPPKKVYMRIGWGRGTLEDNPAYHETKFKKFSRPERRYLLGLLEKTGANSKEMAVGRLRGRWIRLGEILHPGEHKGQFPKAFKAFDDIRNNKVTSWYGDVDRAFEKSFDAGLDKLSKRPGEYSRSLDALIRNNPRDQEKIVKIFEEVAVKVSNKVLFEIMEHFDKRLEKQAHRSVFPKGARRPVPLPILDPLKVEVVETFQAIIWDALTKKFSKEEPLGKVWIDPELSNIPLPRNMRSMSKSMKPIIRGQRIPIPGHVKVVRAFVHWNNTGTNPYGCDIDLAGTLFNETGTDRKTISWNAAYAVDGVVYSGDVTGRPGPCAEYLDIEIVTARSKGWKYAIIDIRDYCRNPEGIADYVDCVFGIMERNKPSANRTWSPKTLENTHQILTPSPGVIVAGIDLETREYFMIDMDTEGHVTTGDMSLFNTIQAAAEPPKVSVKHLLELHAKARGEIVENKDEADTVLEAEDFLHSYEKTAEWMGI